MSFPVFANGDVLNASDMNGVGLWLVKSQTIGTGVSSVTVTGAFSADYDNYVITISGGTASANGSVRLQMNTSTGSTYFMAGTYGNFGVNSGLTYNPAATTSWSDIMLGGTAGSSTYVLLNGPFASRPTYGFTETQNNATFYKFSLVETSTNSNTGFTLTPASGTLTGGTIRVYGYRN
jgi:hypothetical protein